MTSTPYQLVVFDWDGTVMDSTANIVACMRQSLEDIGVTDVSEEAMRGTIGLGFAETLEHLLPGAGPDLQNRMKERYRHHWFALYRNTGTAFPEAQSVMEELDGRGYLLAVATGKGRVGLDHDMQLTGLGKFFLASRTVDEAPSKPHPQMLLDLMSELGTRPERTLMVGDTTHDLDMARNARVPAVGVLSGSHTRELLLGSEPLECLPSIAQLPDWLV